MGERLDFREKTKANLRKARTAASAVIGKLFEDEEAITEQQRQQELVEQRREALESPSYAVLINNLHYQQWAKNHPYTEESVRRDGYESDAFRAVQSGKPYNPYMPDYWREGVIDPNLPESDLHQKCVDYCSGTARNFVRNAAQIAEDFVRGEQPDTQNMKAAIAKLMGTSLDDRDQTIFKDFAWSASGYDPDYLRLDVDPSEMSVPQEKVMAGIGLCIGLWVRLADAGATRPVSGQNFASALNHCSFLSLARDSGWTDYTNIDKFLSEAHSEAYGQTATEKQDTLFALFRDPQFFEDTLAVLESEQ